MVECSRNVRPMLDGSVVPKEVLGLGSLCEKRNVGMIGRDP